MQKVQLDVEDEPEEAKKSDEIANKLSEISSELGSLKESVKQQL